MRIGPYGLRWSMKDKYKHIPLWAEKMWVYNRSIPGLYATMGVEVIKYDIDTHNCMRSQLVGENLEAQ